MSKNNAFNEELIFPEIEEKFPGYENTSAKSVLLIKPPDDNQQQQEDIQSSVLKRDSFLEVPVITKNQIKNVLNKYFNEKSFFGRKSIDDITFTDIQNSNSYRYILKTFYETRTTQWVQEPYNDEFICNNNEKPVEPWDISIKPKKIFHKEIIKIMIPNTVSIKTCNNCNGDAISYCVSCKGTGFKRCKTCFGAGGRKLNIKGARMNHDCIFCDGRGTNNCSSCKGYGKRSCCCCNGSGKLKWQIQMTVTFDTKTDDYIKRSEDIPLGKLRSCKAVTIFSEQNQKLNALDHHYDDEINKSCISLMQNHLNLSQHSKILTQSHCLNAIPVSLCKYEYENKEYEFKVFGLDRQIYIIDSESKLCSIS